MPKRIVCHRQPPFHGHVGHQSELARERPSCPPDAVMTGHSHCHAICVIGPLHREVSTLVRAWLLTEGDQALGGETILLLHRDALSRTMTVVWDNGHRAKLDGDGW